jgi:hypothetical protein
MRFPFPLLALAIGTAPVAAVGQDAPASSVVVTFADGASLPLADWSFSYEFEVLPKGAVSGSVPPRRQESHDLLLGKKRWPTSGAVLEIEYREFERLGRGPEPQTEKVAVARGLRLVSAGKERELRIEGPREDLLAPGGVEKGAKVQPRGVDLVGLTLTGTRRSFCLLAFVPLVECAPAPADRVVKIEFRE